MCWASVLAPRCSASSAICCARNTASSRCATRCSGSTSSTSGRWRTSWPLPLPCGALLRRSCNDLPERPAPPSVESPAALGLKPSSILDDLHVDPDRQQIAKVESMCGGLGKLQVLELPDLHARIV